MQVRGGGCGQERTHRSSPGCWLAITIGGAGAWMRRTNAGAGSRALVRSRRRTWRLSNSPCIPHHGRALCADTAARPRCCRALSCRAPPGLPRKQGAASPAAWTRRLRLAVGSCAADRQARTLLRRAQWLGTRKRSRAQRAQRADSLRHVRGLRARCAETRSPTQAAARRDASARAARYTATSRSVHDGARKRRGAGPR
jgi:hypothetical protein